MVQFIPAQPNPLLDALSSALTNIGAGIGQRFAGQAEARRQEQQQQAMRELLMGQSTLKVGDADSDLNVTPAEAELEKLEQMEDVILSSGPLTPESKAVLQSIRSRRSVVGQALNAGENESAKLAAQRRSKNIETLSGKAEAADSTLQAVNQLETLIAGGETGPNIRNSFLNYTEGHDGVLGAINNYLTTVESQGFKSAQLQFFPQLKQLFGARITDRDLKTFMQSLARLGTDPNAQRLALQTLKQHAEYDKRLGEHVLSLMDDEGKPVSGFEKKMSKVRKELNQEMTENFQTFAQELGISFQETIDFRTADGRILAIPKDNKDAIKKAKEMGFEVAK